MYEYWKNHFVKTAVNYKNISKERALELWEEYEEDFIEDLHTAADALVLDILDKEK